VQNYSGFWYTWALLNNGDDFAAAFADCYVSSGGLLRVRGGDNRPLPVRANPEIQLQPAPDPRDTLTDLSIIPAAQPSEAALNPHAK
jgi:hypothetical protein